MRKLILMLLAVLVGSAVASTNIPVSNVNFYAAPYMWISLDGSTLQTNNVKAGATQIASCDAGAYFKFGFTGTSVGLASWTYGLIVVSIDGGPWQDVQPATNANVVLTNGLASGNHTLKCILSNASMYLTNVVLDTGATLLPCSGAIAIQPNNIIVYSDSTGIGIANMGLPNDAAHLRSELTWIPILSSNMAAEYGAVCYSGQGFEVAGSAVAPLTNFWSVYWSWIYAHPEMGYSRLFSGQLSPAPDYIVCNHGVNGTTVAGDVPNANAQFRSAAPAAKIAFAAPFGWYSYSQIQAGVAACSDNNTKFIDCGAEASTGLTYGSSANAYSADGTHPLATREPFLASAMLTSIYNVFGWPATNSPAVPKTIIFLKP